MDHDFLTSIAAVPPAARNRAPKRRGHRTQLTVPHAQWEEARALAAAAGTTPNDVLVRLAAFALHELRKRREVQAVAEARTAAALGAEADGGAAVEWPSQAEYRDAVLRMRTDDE